MNTDIGQSYSHKKTLIVHSDKSLRLENRKCSSCNETAEVYMFPPSPTGSSMNVKTRIMYIHWGKRDEGKHQSYTYGPVEIECILLDYGHTIESAIALMDTFGK